MGSNLGSSALSSSFASSSDVLRISSRGGCPSKSSHKPSASLPTAAISKASSEMEATRAKGGPLPSDRCNDTAKLPGWNSPSALRTPSRPVSSFAAAASRIWGKGMLPSFRSFSKNSRLALRQRRFMPSATMETTPSCASLHGQASTWQEPVFSSAMTPHNTIRVGSLVSQRMKFSTPSERKKIRRGLSRRNRSRLGSTSSNP
mmetsp:Transcript_48120/g.114344  ORF Transcript_48120/g.114344 Transcript_48120/m.114344 type:complete len:203 (+) Transcript_48120:100-708(+)